MNQTVDGSSSISREASSAANYSIGFSLAVLLVLVIISYISYKCNSKHAIAVPDLNNSSSHGSPIYPGSTIDDASVNIPRGLDEETLVSYPSFLYSQVNPHIGDSIASGCSICLADYKDHHMLRLLPECGHLFHIKCIDPWLKLHPTCPICRTSPLPTPLAEVVPLATQRN